MRVNALHWTLLTTIGLAAGIAAGARIGVIPITMLVIGGILGVCQAAVLQQRPSWWIVATIVGASAGLAAGIVAVQEIATVITGGPLRIAALSSSTRALTLLSLGLVAGCFLGAAQWAVFRVKNWVVISAIALAIALGLASLLVDASGVRYASELGRWMFLIVAGLTFGGLTSGPLRAAN